MHSRLLGSAAGFILMLVGCAKPAPVPPAQAHGPMDCPCSDKDGGSDCPMMTDCRHGAGGPMMADGGMMHHGDMMHHGGPMMADGGMMHHSGPMMADGGMMHHGPGMGK